MEQSEIDEHQNAVITRYEADHDTSEIQNNKHAHQFLEHENRPTWDTCCGATAEREHTPGVQRITWLWRNTNIF